MKFKIFIESLVFELIDVSTHSEINFKKSGTSIKYIAVKEHQKLKGSFFYKGDISEKEAIDIIDKEIN